MKILFITLLLFHPLLAHASVPCNPRILYECGEKWDLLGEIGERIKHEEEQPTPNRTKLNALRAEFDNLAWVKNTEFDKNSVDAIKSRLPADSYFDATTTPINPEGGFIQPETSLGILIAIILAIAGWFGYKKIKK